MNEIRSASGDKARHADGEGALIAHLRHPALDPDLATNRPRHAQAWQRFQQVDIPLVALGEKIGGKVGVNIATGIFSNPCPIRISYVLNYSGFPVPRPQAAYSAVSGRDHKWYLFRMREMIDYLDGTLGPADETIEEHTAADLARMHGLLILRGTGWSDATGWVTPPDGSVAPADPQAAAASATFVPHAAMLWRLA